MSCWARSKVSRSAGSGSASACAMASIIFREGLALPFVRSDRKEIDMFALSASSFFVMFRSSRRRRTLVKKIRLYKGLLP